MHFYFIAREAYAEGHDIDRRYCWWRWIELSPTRPTKAPTLLSGLNRLVFSKSSKSDKY